MSLSVVALSALSLLACSARKPPADTASTTVETTDDGTGSDSTDSDSTDPDSTDPSVPQGPVLLVSAYTSGTVYRLDTASGLILGDLGSVPGAQSVHPGPDGALYLVAEAINQVIRRVDGVNAPFVFDDPETDEDETGGLSSPTSAVWGPDGLLYVGGFASDSVHRFDAEGAFVDVFVRGGTPGGIAGLDGPDAGLRFGPDGDLYLPCFYGDRVLVLDAGTGELVRSLDDGTSRPRALHFDEADNLWVTAWGAGAVLRFGADGARLDDLGAVAAPSGLVVGEEGAWVGTDQTNMLTLLDVATGEALRTIDGAALGMEGVTWLTWE